MDNSVCVCVCVCVRVCVHACTHTLDPCSHINSCFTNFQEGCYYLEHVDSLHFTSLAFIMD